MNLRHAAALALVGWYLMIPPMDKDFNVMTNAPLAQWKIETAWDSAEGCRDELEAMPGFSEVTRRTLATAEARKSASEQEITRTLRHLDQLDAAQCVSADDPRLKEK